MSDASMSVDGDWVVLTGDDGVEISRVPVARFLESNATEWLAERRETP